jgi:hypothetical protein
MKITEIRLVECRLPPPKPFRQWPIEVRTCDFALIRSVRESGFASNALSYSLRNSIERCLKKQEKNYSAWALGR